jgi:dTDP-4-dehydrorhamnose 3,5-epimerase
MSECLSDAPETPALRATNPLPGNVFKLELPDHGDDRGLLVALQDAPGFLFPIERIYYIFGTKTGIVRGYHAHKRLKQLLICVSGSCVVDTEIVPGVRTSHPLSFPTQALQIEGLVWREMRDFSPDAVLLVLADARHNEDDYVRDYSDFEYLSMITNS